MNPNNQQQARRGRVFNDDPEWLTIPQAWRFGVEIKGILFLHVAGPDDDLAALREEHRGVFILPYEYRDQDYGDWGREELAKILEREGVLLNRWDAVGELLVPHPARHIADNDLVPLSEARQLGVAHTEYRRWTMKDNASVGVGPSDKFEHPNIDVYHSFSFELVSPILTNMDEGFSHLARVLNILYSREVYFNTSGGVDVHVGLDQYMMPLSVVRRIAAVCFASDMALTRYHWANAQDNCHRMMIRTSSNVAHGLTVLQARLRSLAQLAGTVDFARRHTRRVTIEQAAVQILTADSYATLHKLLSVDQGTSLTNYRFPTYEFDPLLGSGRASATIEFNQYSTHIDHSEDVIAWVKVCLRICSFAANINEATFVGVANWCDAFETHGIDRDPDDVFADVTWQDLFAGMRGLDDVLDYYTIQRPLVLDPELPADWDPKQLRKFHMLPFTPPNKQGIPPGLWDLSQTTYDLYNGKGYQGPPGQQAPAPPGNALGRGLALALAAQAQAQGRRPRPRQLPARLPPPYDAPPTPSRQPRLRRLDFENPGSAERINRGPPPAPNPYKEKPYHSSSSSSTSTGSTPSTDPDSPGGVPLKQDGNASESPNNNNNDGKPPPGPAMGGPAEPSVYPKSSFSRTKPPFENNSPESMSEQDRNAPSARGDETEEVDIYGRVGPEEELLRNTFLNTFGPSLAPGGVAPPPQRGEGRSIVEQFQNLNLRDREERRSPVTNRDVGGASLDELRWVLGDNNNSAVAGPSSSSGGSSTSYNTPSSSDSSWVMLPSPASLLSVERRENAPPLFLHPAVRNNAGGNGNNNNPNPNGPFAVHPMALGGGGGNNNNGGLPSPPPERPVAYHPTANASGSGVPAPNRPTMFRQPVGLDALLQQPQPGGASPNFQPPNPDTVVIEHPTIGGAGNNGNGGGFPPQFRLADRFRNAPLFFMSEQDLNDAISASYNAGIAANNANNAGGNVAPHDGGDAGATLALGTDPQLPRHPREPQPPDPAGEQAVGVPSVAV
ncbi:hypothetical protein PG988_008007 [Apiospora saccharicola]